MQEEVESRVVVVIQGTARLTSNVLRTALTKALANMKQKHDRKAALKEARKAEGPHGKMTVKELAAKDRGLQKAEFDVGDEHSFDRVARKFGVDYATYKVKGEDKFMVFFKAPDSGAMEAAFEEYTRKNVITEERPSVRKALTHLRSLIKSPVKDTTRNKVPQR